MIVFTISVKCAVKNTASRIDLWSQRGIVSGMRPFGASSPTGRSIKSLVRVAHEAVKHPLQTWNVGSDVRVRRQQHNERQIKHGEELPWNTIACLDRGERTRGFGLGRVASLGIDLQVKPDYGSPSSSFVVSNVQEKKKDSLLLSLAIPQMPPAWQRFWIYDPGDCKRIDDRYTSRSHLTGVVNENDLRTDCVVSTGKVVSTLRTALFLSFFLWCWERSSWGSK